MADSTVCIARANDSHPLQLPALIIVPVTAASAADSRQMKDEKRTEIGKVD